MPVDNSSIPKPGTARDVAESILRWSAMISAADFRCYRHIGHCNDMALSRPLAPSGHCRVHALRK
jgi:hypothetical protein